MGVTTPTTDDELRAAYKLTTQAFNGPGTDVENFLKTVVTERCRCVMVDGEMAAYSQVRPFGEFFGGRSVPMGGFSPVAVNPEFRGRGLGSRVTAAHFPAMRERGEVISGLYPASTRLYRGVGFEIAGAWGTFVVPTRSLQMLRPEAGVAIRRGTRDDIPAIKACYQRVAAQRPGWLDRPDVWWENILERFDDQYAYVVDGTGGALEGYIRYTHRARRDRFGYTIVLSDMVADRNDVTIALWRLVGTSSTQAEEVSFTGPPEHPLLFLLPEQDIEWKGGIRWMLRLIDAPAAVAARGFSTSVALTADIEVDDRECEWNSGRWRLTVEDGHGRLNRGGDGTIRLNVNGFSSLYSGYASTRMLADAGTLRGGTSSELDALSAAFVGPTPWSIDFY